jgi:hypothetical protein
MSTALAITVEALAFQKKMTLSPLDYTLWTLRARKECEALGNSLAASLLEGYWLGSMTR